MHFFSARLKSFKIWFTTSLRILEQKYARSSEKKMSREFQFPIYLYSAVQPSFPEFSDKTSCPPAPLLLLLVFTQLRHYSQPPLKITLKLHLYSLFQA